MNIVSLSIIIIVTITTAVGFVDKNASDVSTRSPRPKFRVIKEWKVVNFTWPDAETYRKAVEERRYVPEHNVIANVKYHDRYYYVTLPRDTRRTGVPTTVARVRLVKGASSTDFEPYPSWDVNDVGTSIDCNETRLYNAKSIEIDTQNRIWVLDNPRNDEKCLPKLVIFDIFSHQVFRIQNFPADAVLESLVVDENGSRHGNGSYNGYIIDNDVTDPKILVYSVKNNNWWKVRLATASQTIALGPPMIIENSNRDDHFSRDVYIQPKYSLTFIAFNSSSLQHDRFEILSDFRKIKGSLLATEIGGSIMDNRRHFYYGFVSKNAIVKCRLTSDGLLKDQGLIALDREYIKWPNSFTFDDQGNLTVLINNNNRDDLDVHEFNFRLISAHVGAESYLYDDDGDDYNNKSLIVARITSSTSVTVVSRPWLLLLLQVIYVYYSVNSC